MSQEPECERQGRELLETAFAILDPQLGRSPYVAGDVFTIADAALFYTERWAPLRNIAMPVNDRSLSAFVQIDGG